MNPVIKNPYDPRKILVHRDKLRDLAQGKIPYPITLEVDLADGACNNKCIFCCFNNNVKKDLVLLNKDTLIKNLKIAYQNGTSGLELVGGSEPTLHPDIAEIISLADEIGYQVSLVTNGLLLHKVFSVAKKLKYLRISIDAGSSTTYSNIHGVNSYNTVLQNIEKITKEGNRPQKIGLAFLCVPQNTKEDEMRTFTKKAVSLDVDYIVFRPAILKEEWNTNHLNKVSSIIQKIKKDFVNELQIYSSVGNRWKLARTLKRKENGRCYTNCLTGIIQANGDIPICNIKRGQNSQIIGNLYKNNFDEIWQDRNHIRINNEIDINDCPVPCKADDYRKILSENLIEIFQEKDLVSVDNSADMNFV